MAILICSGAEMPTPVEIKIGNEILWSSNTGRTTSGKMVGDVVAEKEDLEISWAYIREAQLKKIRSGLPAGFFSVTFKNAGKLISWQGYRGTISSVDMGDLGDGQGHCYRSVSVKIVQQ